MDLGIKGKYAVVCASSQGLGLACATALAREYCTVIINGRDPDRLTRAQASIEISTGAKVGMVVADINTEAGREALFAACPTADILVNNNAGPAPGQLADWDHSRMVKISIRTNIQINAATLAATAAQPSAGSSSSW